MLLELYAQKNIRMTTGTLVVGTIFRSSEEQAAKYISDGSAIPMSEYIEQPWGGLLWQGCEVVILASGESLSSEMVDVVRIWRDKDLAHRKVIVINTTFRLAPWADVLFACDGRWWKHYIDEVRTVFKGQLWTQDIIARKNYGINLIQSRRGAGLNKLKGVINQGENSGYQAIGLSYQSGAKKNYLLGFDMHGGHWHGPHPGVLEKENEYISWLVHFKKLAVDLKIAGIEVINCTPGSALNDFPLANWKEIFND